MKFSIYSELQGWPEKPPEQLYAEALEQVVNADRLGYDTYAVVEHFFFPKFSVSADPIAFFAAAAQRTNHIRFRTLVHVLPYHNPMVLASRLSVAHLLTGGRYEFGLGRGHPWLPARAGVRMSETRERYDEAMDIILQAFDGEPFSHDGQFWNIRDGATVPALEPGSAFRMFAGGTRDRTYELAGERGWGMVVPPLLPYEALREPLDLYRESCRRHGNEPEIVWIHACYLDSDRDTAHREAQQGMINFLAGNASPLTEHEKPNADEMNANGYGFYAKGLLEELAQTPYDAMVEQDIVWVGTPADIIERIENVRAVCEGLTEISITVNYGGVPHWQAIKTQEVFAHDVMPHFKRAGRASSDT